MIRSITISADGSPTLFNPELSEHYHSIHGAVAESMHIFIREGLQQVPYKNVKIFEMGFGTGLNALLTLEHAISQGLNVEYTTIEKYPLIKSEWKKLDYSGFVSAEAWNCFKLLHNCKWEEECPIFPGFSLKKIKTDILILTGDFEFNLVYFDAFSPQVQPELWSEGVFRNICNWLSNEGILTTYSSRGSVRRAMQASGFSVERVKGPTGKREILRARKTDLSSIGK